MLRVVFAALLCALPTAVSALDLDQYTTFRDGGRPYYNIRVGNLDPAIGGRLGMVWNESFRWADEHDVVFFGQSTDVLPDDVLPVNPGVTAPVPEPGEWAMIVAGLGVVSYAAARRRRLSGR